MASGSSLGTGNITVMAKGPGASGFVDLHGAFSYQSASDGSGGRLGALSSSIAILADLNSINNCLQTRSCI